MPWDPSLYGSILEASTALLQPSKFPVASALSEGLNILKPGGMRELHWHAVDEWAFVINGICRGLVLEYGSEHPTNSWDWHTGDIWHASDSCSPI